MSNLVHNDEFPSAAPTLIKRIIAACLQPFSLIWTSLSQWNRLRIEVNEQRRLAREEMRLDRIDANRTWKNRLYETVYMVLDYDPTDAESGVTSQPSVGGAICQWFLRVVWTRRIELGGVLLLSIVGGVCYYMITANLAR